MGKEGQKRIMPKIRHMGRQKPYKDASRIADILRKEISSAGMALIADDEAFRDRIRRWLEGSQHVLGSFAGSEPPLRYASATGEIRGASGSADNIVNLSAEIGDDGFFEFSLSETTSLSFKVKQKTKYGQPICLVITGRDDTVYPEVYQLSAFGRESLCSQRIELNAGDYALCVPTA